MSTAQQLDQGAFLGIRRTNQNRYKYQSKN